MSSLQLFRRHAASLALIVLTGCANTGHYDVLLPRPIEQAQAEDVLAHHKRPAPPPAMVPALRQQLKSISANAASGDEAFRALNTRSSTILAAGRTAPQQSDAWVAAEETLSALEAARGPTVSAHHDIDALYIQAMVSNDGGVDEILHAQHDIAQIEDAQNVILAQWRIAVSHPDTPDR